MKRHAASLVAVLALLVGCGGGDGNDPEPIPPSQSATELKISASPDGRSGDQSDWTLRCSPTGGSLPDPEEACRQLERLDRPFVRPANAICTEIYGGPAVADVRGTFEGREVKATFSRTDGCEIARWDRHAFLFPVALDAQ
ncbi:MAG: hypothetical protein H0V79_13220 [Actinobacteria bacterium]|nr:hypothetical protein [Actinomycetota bacterium]